LEEETTTAVAATVLGSCHFRCDSPHTQQNKIKSDPHTTYTHNTHTFEIWRLD